MTVDPGSVHRECVVDDAAPRTMARAALRARLTSPGFVAFIALEAFAGLLVVATGPVWLGVCVVAAALLSPVVLVLQTRRLARTLAARGFQPGTTLGVDWGTDRFVVTTPLAHATHAYTDVRSVKAWGSAVVIRMRAARLLVVLPAELVPNAVRGQLGVVRQDGRATAGPR